jgi:hypothetical protein
VVAGVDELLDRLVRCGVGAAFVALTLATACSDSGPRLLALGSRPAEKTSGEVARPVAVGGSPVSLDSALTLFRLRLSPVSELRHGATSMPELIEAFSRTVSGGDTTRLRTMVMSRQEFAWLYYPSSRYTRAPTLQEPALAWFLHLQHSQKGATRLLNRFGGRPLEVVSNTCAEPVIEGRNRIWHDCMQRAVSGNDTVQMRLFGGIYERDGVYKILTYANDL